jgi:hypothetical protein
MGRIGNLATRRVLAVASVAAVAVAAGACFEHNYTIGVGAPAGVLVHDEWRHHWLGGLIDPNNELMLSEVCPSGNATIESEMTFLNGLVSVLTSGIYSPTTVRVRCADTRAALDINLDVHDVARIVRDPAFLSWVGTAAPERLAEVKAAQLDLLAD